MRSYTAAVAASSLLAIVSGAPIFARDNTCGVAPGGSNTKNQPVRQPTEIQTSADCQTRCHETSECQSFCFGLVDNVIQCKLFSCAASAVPVQSSANLVVYDKACLAVPSVVPTSNNPTGKEGNQEKSSDTRPVNQPQSTPQQQKYQQKAAGNDDNDINAHSQQKPSPTPTSYRLEYVPQGQGQQKKPTPTPVVPRPGSLGQGEKHDEQKKPSPTPTPIPTPNPQAPNIAPIVENKHQQEQKPAPTPTPSPAARDPQNVHQVQEQQQQKQKPSPTATPTAPRPQNTPHAQQQAQQYAPQQQKQNSSPGKANTCGSKPASTAAHEPFATPFAVSVDSCKAQCSARSDCKSFACGVVNNGFACKLYAVEASAIPASMDSAQKLNIVAYDIGCSV